MPFSFLGLTIRSQEGRIVDNICFLTPRCLRAGLVLVRKDALYLAAWDLSRWWPCKLTCDYAGLGTTHASCACDREGHGRCHWIKTQVLTSQFPDSCRELLSHHGHLKQLRNNPARSHSKLRTQRDSKTVLSVHGPKVSRCFCLLAKGAGVNCQSLLL